MSSIITHSDLKIIKIGFEPEPTENINGDLSLESSVELRAAFNGLFSNEAVLWAFFTDDSLTIGLKGDSDEQQVLNYAQDVVTGYLSGCNASVKLVNTVHNDQKVEVIGFSNVLDRNELDVFLDVNLFEIFTSSESALFYQMEDELLELSDINEVYINSWNQLMIKLYEPEVDDWDKFLAQSAEIIKRYVYNK